MAQNFEGLDFSGAYDSINGINGIFSKILEELAKAVPEGHARNCAISSRLCVNIGDLVYDIGMIAADRKLNEQQAEDTVEYLSCVKAGLEAFCSQQGIEVGQK